MRTLSFVFILLLCGSCGQPAENNSAPEPESAEPSQTDVPAEEPATLDSVTQENVPMVYVTHDGDKYHTADCRYSKTAQPVKLSLAKADGKTACNICKPSSKTGEKQVRCSGTTAEGKRCQRMTTDSSGTCFQHRDS